MISDNRIISPRSRRHTRRIIAGLLAGVVLALGPAASAQKTGPVTGLTLPRFVSLRADTANLRTGPGTRYPVEWILVYRNMPVEVLDEFETWRQIRDWQGSTGWVHRALLSGKRWVIIRDGIQSLRKEPRPDGLVIARIKKKVIGRLESCQGVWCEFDFSGFRGWMRRDQVWGVYANEKIK